MKIAIVGSGISGLGAAHLLHPRHEITLFESASYAGGHSRTIDIPDGSQTLPVDTGFIVFNKRNYPLLTRLFEKLDVPIIESDMSFGATIDNGWLEYGSKGLFAQKKNLFRPEFWGMLRDIFVFNRSALKAAPTDPSVTLGSFLSTLKMGDWFRRYYLEAMGAAIWSTPSAKILDFPATAFLTFFENHGLLTVNGHPQWYTVRGGSREYVRRITSPLGSSLKLNCAVKEVRRTSQGIDVTDAHGNKGVFDHVILATHADQALALIASPTELERRILSGFEYTNNRVVTHSDPHFMPTHKGAWASWVYLAEERHARETKVSLTYWMNQLQNFKSVDPVLITLNPSHRPEAGRIFDETEFRHPLFSPKTLAAQSRLGDIDGKNRISFCGAYHGSGFHEDGLRSAVAVAQTFGCAL